MRRPPPNTQRFQRLVASSGAPARVTARMRQPHPLQRFVAHREPHRRLQWHPPITARMRFVAP
eukprot:6428482-Pyramimonas_sp.AAC.1